MTRLVPLLMTLAACVPDPDPSNTCVIDPADPLACGKLQTLPVSPLPSTCTPPDDDVDLTVELGTGTSSFVPLVDPAPLDIETGFQGGYHAYASVLVDGLRPAAPDDVALAFWIAVGPSCVPPAAPSTDGPMPTTFGDLVPAGCDRILGRTTFVTATEGGVVDGTFTSLGWLVLFGGVRPDPQPALLGTWVQDACGRSATALHAIQLR